MAKPMCRPHLNADKTVLTGTLTRLGIVVITFAVVAVMWVLFRNQQWAAGTVLGVANLVLLAYDRVHLGPKVERKAKWVRVGTAQCGACRAVAEGRRTPDGEPLHTTDTDTP